jgi:hypothetical protein
MKKGQSVIEFIHAENERIGHVVWADKLLAALDEAPMRYDPCDVLELSDLILKGFSWQKTKEGDEYWTTIYDKVVHAEFKYADAGRGIYRRSNK